MKKHSKKPTIKDQTSIAQLALARSVVKFNEDVRPRSAIEIDAEIDRILGGRFHSTNCDIKKLLRRIVTRRFLEQNKQAKKALHSIQKFGLIHPPETKTVAAVDHGDLYLIHGIYDGTLVEITVNLSNDYTPDYRLCGFASVPFSDSSNDKAIRNLVMQIGYEKFMRHMGLPINRSRWSDTGGPLRFLTCLRASDAKARVQNLFHDNVIVVR